MIKVIFLTLVKEIESCDYVHEKKSGVYRVKKGSDYDKVVLCEVSDSSSKYKLLTCLLYPLDQLTSP